ncbi:MAG: glycoside hydrolase family 16 protein [Austwickia sp.]|nr:glycoside hydrolase family 16 protein [Austwickia sp.]MBK9100942.1 glycoside hydrolase family 16 protein [Austwickia sp.]
MTLVLLLNHFRGPKPTDGLAPPSPPGPHGGPGGAWQITFADEFNESAIDANRWTRGRGGEGITDAVNKHQKNCFDSENAWVEGGAAKLRVEPRPSSCQIGDQPNTGAFISTNGKFGQAYGYFEARIKVPRGLNVWTAWWLNADPWPDSIEVDIMETDGDDEADFNVHYACPKPDRNGSCNMNGRHNTIPLGATQDYHVYAAEVTPEGVRWFYDGREVGQWKGEVPPRERALIFDIKSTKGPVNGPSVMSVDYVRAWKR